MPCGRKQGLDAEPWGCRFAPWALGKSHHLIMAEERGLGQVNVFHTVSRGALRLRGVARVKVARALDFPLPRLKKETTQCFPRLFLIFFGKRILLRKLK